MSTIPERLKNQVQGLIDKKFHDPLKGPDFVYHYIVYKAVDNVSIDMDTLIKTIVGYVQSHEVYFKYDPSFFNGTLIFGIVGYKSDQDALRKSLHGKISRPGCNLKRISTNKLEMQEDK